MRKIAVLGLVFGTLALISGVSRFVSAGSLIGDVNSDSQVNSLDASLILQYSAGLIDHLGPRATATPRPTSTPTIGSSRQHPVPRGDSLTIPEGWRVSVTDFVADATDEVLAANQFNSPPESGMKYVMVRLQMTNVSAADPANPDAGFAFRLVGSENVSYTTFENSCGVAPDDIDDQSHDVFRDGTVEGNLCYEVSAEETGFAIFTSFFFGDDANRRWFAVD